MPFWFSSLFLGGAVVLLLLIGIPLAVACWVLSKTTFLCAGIETQPAGSVPNDLQKYFAEEIAFLESHQFQLAGYYTVEATQGNVQWSVFLQDAEKQIHAAAVIRQPQQATFAPVQISFSTVFGDDTKLITVNEREPGIFPPNPKQLMQYRESASIDELLQIHQCQLNELLETKTAQTLTAENYIDDVNARAIEETEHLKQLGKVYWVKPQESYRLGWWMTVISTIKVASAMWLTANPTPPSRVAATETTRSLASRVEIEFAEFQRQRQQQTGLSRRTRSWLFLGTLAFFVAVYASAFDPQGLLIFVAVLLLHEGGHVLAMKFFGYRDTAILFIPFLGALATARNEDATLTEKVWISLAGPLPGLCLAIGLAMAPNLGWLTPANWMQEAIAILVFLNLFNLLPIYPLDGGQVADLLLFSRNPYLGVFFKAIGAGLLVLIGLLLQAPLLFAFAVLIGISIPGSFRLAKLNVRLQKEFRANSQTSIATEDPDTLVRLIFQRLQQAPYDRLSFGRKYALVTGILDSRKETAAPWTTRVGLSIAYLVSLLVGFVGGVFAIWFAPIPESAVVNYSGETGPEPPVQAATIPYECRADNNLQVIGTGDAAEIAGDRQVTISDVLSR